MKPLNELGISKEWGEWHNYVLAPNSPDADDKLLKTAPKLYAALHFIYSHISFTDLGGATGGAEVCETAMALMQAALAEASGEAIPLIQILQ